MPGNGAKSNQGGGKKTVPAKAVQAEVVTPEPKPPSRSRWGQIIDSMESGAAADAKNTSRVFSIAADLASTLGMQPSEMTPSTVRQAVRQLPGRAASPSSRFSRLVNDFEAINQADMKADARLYGATASLFRAAQSAANTNSKSQLVGDRRRKQIAS